METLKNVQKNVQKWKKIEGRFEKTLWSQGVFPILQLWLICSHFYFSYFSLFFIEKLLRFSFLDIFKNVQKWKILKSLGKTCFFSYWEYLLDVIRIVWNWKRWEMKNNIEQQKLCSKNFIFKTPIFHFREFWTFLEMETGFPNEEFFIQHHETLWS